MHDLEMFAQSARQPGLSHLPPRSVLECSDHWSLSRGAGMQAWCGLAIPVRRMQARAILTYLAVRPFDATAFYVASGFVNAGEPVECPYVEMLDGTKILVQPMILEGQPLRRLAAVLSRLFVESHDDARIMWFRDTVGLGPASDGPLFPLFKVATAIRPRRATAAPPRAAKRPPCSASRNLRRAAGAPRRSRAAPAEARAGRRRARVFRARNLTRRET